MIDFEMQIKREFLDECVDLLDSAENAFLQLGQSKDNENLLDEIFRLAHNLKGSSNAVGFDQLGSLTHIAESLILKLKNGDIQVSETIVSALLSFNDKVNEMVVGLIEDMDARFSIDHIIEQLESAMSNVEELNVDETDAPTCVDENISAAALESLIELGIEPELVLSPEVCPVEIVEVDSGANVQSSSVKRAIKEDESIRVKLDRIDKLTDVIGELIILQTVLGERRYEFIKDDLSNKSIGHMEKLFKEAQELSMSFRMLPVKSTFQKMARIVRDTSLALGKKVKLNIVGEETEVDKTVLEKLSDPLVHMIRNAVDHGIEKEDERVSAGKPKEGIVELMAFHEGSNLVIQITDDGKGMDARAIEAKAIEKGIITKNAGLSDNEVLQLVFQPGFSTKEEVTEVSGRGVGMDVVKTNIESLGGVVQLMSKIGQGSSFKIVLPLTLAIIDGIIITSLKEKFVIPLSQVFELTNVCSEKIEHFSGGLDLITLRGEVMPLFHINTKLGKKLVSNENQIVIIVRGLTYAFGVVVNDILNQQQIVIKKIGDDIKSRKGIIGAAIMGDGSPSFILDLFELFKDDLKKSRSYQKLKNSKRSA